MIFKKTDNAGDFRNQVRTPKSLISKQGPFTISLDLDYLMLTN